MSLVLLCVLCGENGLRIFLAFLATWRLKMNLLFTSNLKLETTLCVSAVNNDCLCAFVVKMYCLCFCSFGGFLPHSRQKWHSGGILPYIRRTCVISAPHSLTPAATKSHFSGCTGASRQSFRRENVQFVQNSHFTTKGSPLGRIKRAHNRAPLQKSSTRCASVSSSLCVKNPLRLCHFAPLRFGSVY